MLGALTGFGLTVASLVVIGLVFLIAVIQLGRELRWVKTLADQLGYALATGDFASGGDRPPPNIMCAAVHDEMRAARTGDATTAHKIIRGWEMRVHRLEPALGFWIDLLRQLGLLGTVLGLGLAFAVDSRSTDILEPLSLAVWTTVAGLALSIWLSAQYGTRIPMWADACEKNIAVWRAEGS